MGREKNLFSDTCEASCLAAASLCAEESAAYVRDVYRLPSTYVRSPKRAGCWADGHETDGLINV